MKKFLLCAMAMAAVCATAGAEEWTLNVKDATDIQGTDVPEKPAEGTSNGQARHIQPLESLKIDDFAFTFGNDGGKTEPAYYYAMSTNPNGTITIRLYVSNKMTITAPAGKEFKSIKVYNGNSETVVYNGDKVSTYTYNATGSVKFDKLVISDAEGTVNPPVTGDITVKKATTFTPGEVSFVFNEGFVETFAETAKFGYWMAVSTTIADEIKVTDKAIFTVESTDKGYTVKDMYGRYMGWDGQHWSFNPYTTPEDGNSYWEVTMVDGTVKIVNKTKSSDGKEVYLAGKTYNNDYEMCPTDRDNQTLPMLYVKSTESGVADIVVDENAPAVYYNLQGVRVDNPTSGMYIVVKGGKSQKVAF